MKIIQEFKAFAMHGSVVDLAVGIIIGAAFTSIVNSLVKDVVMPPIGAVINNVDFNDLVLKITPPIGGHPVVIRYGAFINNTISFVIVAFCVFMLVKVMNKLIKKEEAKPAPPTNEEKLLAEIRDLLKNRP